MEVFLETPRLLLRRLTRDDVDHLRRLDSDPDVLRFTNPGGRCAPRGVYENEILPRFLAYYDRYAGYGYWAAVDKPAGDFLGWFHFRPARDESGAIELGYRLLPIGRGPGYATEAARALMHRGFTELGVARVVATALTENAASRRVMEKVGLQYEKTFVYPGLNLEGVEYALNRDDWRMGR